jgi:hypothetical protein
MRTTREWIALLVITLSVLSIGGVSYVAIAFADPDGRAEMSRLVFGSLLPLLGTWVGTILAFYFARDNLQAATASTVELLRQGRSDTIVWAAMIPRAEMVVHKAAAGEDVDTLRLADLYTAMTDAERARLPILTASDGVRYVVHKATIDRFATTVGTQPTALPQTVADLLADPKLKVLVEAIAVVGPTAVLDDARKAMRSVDNCNDVFVTTTGRRDDPVAGWLTNTDLAGAE